MKLNLCLRPMVVLACAALLAATTFTASAQLPPTGWSYAAWTSDATSGVDGTKTYTHAFNFASGVNAVINGITFAGTGAATVSPSGSSFSTVGLVSRFNNDPNNQSAGGSRTLANDFNYGGGGNNVVESITVNNLVPGGEYTITVYSVGWDDAPYYRAATFSAGNDR